MTKEEKEKLERKEAAKTLANSRWAKYTPEERKEQMKPVTKARLDKQRSRKNKIKKSGRLKELYKPT